MNLLSFSERDAKKVMERRKAAIRKKIIAIEKNIGEF
jgi:hypothetical protein